jgi:hypothetical protein
MKPINGDVLYSVEPSDDESGPWRLIGPNGLVGEYASEKEAQAKADFLNEQSAQGTEDDS